jgi:hypothetical protein
LHMVGRTIFLAFERGWSKYISTEIGSGVGP